eukprot:763176-Hanusia_phi.AAC.1
MDTTREGRRGPNLSSPRSFYSRASLEDLAWVGQGPALQFSDPPALTVIEMKEQEEDVCRLRRRSRKGRNDEGRGGAEEEEEEEEE